MGNLIGFSALKTTTVSGNLLLRLGLSTAGTVGTRTICLGNRNIVLADYGGTTDKPDYLILCVFNHSAAVAHATKTVNVTGKRYQLATSSESFVIVCDQPTDKTPANSIVLGNRAIAVNAAGELIAKDCTTAIGTPDEEDVVFVGDQPLRVVRKGSNWYLGVKA
jgi:hypothetical protein